jgi:CoA:oxalate CoA-transferase
MDSNSTRRPLDGVRVLDLSRVVSGPAAGRFLADLGADVVKVEPPEGDVTRLWGAVKHGVPGFFLQQNAGKRGMCIDLRVEGAANVVIEMARHADVLIENFRGGVMDRLGIGWQVLHAANPRLVMLSITGFGQTGPEAHRPAYASVIQAEAGLLGRLSQADERAPSDTITSIADYNAGLHGTIGLLAALFQAQRTGLGDHLDIAMVDAMLATDDYVHYALDDEPTPRLGGEYFQTADSSWTVISGPIAHVFRVLSASAGIADPVPMDSSLSAVEKTQLRRHTLRAHIAAMPDRAALTAMLDTAKLPWGALQQPSEAVRSPTVVHRKTVAHVPDGPGSTRKVIQTPYRFAMSQSGARSRSPHLGEHNRAALNEWAHYSDEQIDELTRQGILLVAAEPPAV